MCTQQVRQSLYIGVFYIDHCPRLLTVSLGCRQKFAEQTLFSDKIVVHIFVVIKMITTEASKNCAFKDMKVNGSTVSGGTSTDANGLDIIVAGIKDKVVYEGLGWQFSGANPVWKMGNTNYPLPVLYWQTPDTYPAKPAHL